jgi:hypothetical protein
MAVFFYLEASQAVLPVQRVPLAARHRGRGGGANLCRPLFYSGASTHPTFSGVLMLKSDRLPLRNRRRGVSLNPTGC